MPRSCLLLFLCAGLTQAQLATTDDGCDLLLSTNWRLTGEPFERNHFAIYRASANRWTPVAHTDQGPLLSRPFLSGDGAVAAWDRALPCSGSCSIGIPRIFTEFQGLTPPTSIGTYNLILSRNARFLLAPGYLGLVDFALADPAANRQWTTPTVPNLRAFGVANDGAVIGLASTRPEGGFSNPVIPHRVVVWRPSGETTQVFQAPTDANIVRNAWISADGVHALVDLAGPDQNQPREFWYIDIATQNRQRIAQLPPDGSINFLDPANHQIANDGSRVLYLWPSQNNAVWLWQPGAEPRALARADEGFLSAVLSGDGRIAWALTAAGRLLRIAIDTNAADTNARLVCALAASQTLNGFRVIRVRRAGYGTNAPKHPLTLQDHASHIWALAEHLDIKTLHLVGHSSGGLIALQVASDHPELVRSLVLLEPAPCGPLQVPAFAEIGERFVGPAMGALAAGNLEGAFDTFMRGVCGDRHREVIEQSIGKPAYEQAVRESRFFFRDEVPAAMQWKFGTAEAARIRQPVLIVEGAEGRKHGLLSRQVTELAMTLLPHAQFAMIEGVNHLMPLQDPDAVGRVIAGFARRHPILSAGAGRAMA